MVVRYIGDAQWTALDADTKPTTAAVADTLTTTNTQRRFIHQGGGVWVEIGIGGGGGGGLSAGGQISFNGTAAQTIFNIPHGLSVTPSFISVEPASTDAFGSFTTTRDATNVIVTYQIPPPAGTANVTFQWGAGEVGVATGGLTATSTTTLTNKSFDNVTILDAKNIILNTTTGTKIGTATTQKLGFYNATPVVQPAANPNTTGAALAALETEVNELKALLRSVGLMAP